MSDVGWSVLAGLTLGLGLWILVASMPRMTRPRLADRVAPYLADVSASARELARRRPATVLPVLAVLVAPVSGMLRRVLAASLGGTAVVRARLRQAGSPLTVEGYRSRQLAWLAGACAVGIVLAVASPSAAASPVAFAVVVVGCAVAGVFSSDRVLAGSAKRRLARLSLELPAVLEFLALSLSAGEGIADGLRRLARFGSGELAVELQDAVANVNTGVPLATAMQSLAAELGLPAFTRFVNQLVGALERGSPIVEVLRAQAQDARDEHKRQLLETAGRKEVSMLVPLVFLILPATVIFAVFPGVVVLQMGF